jgi:hypothetical protein
MYACERETEFGDVILRSRSAGPDPRSWIAELAGFEALSTELGPSPKAVRPSRTSAESYVNVAAEKYRSLPCACAAAMAARMALSFVP